MRVQLHCQHDWEPNGGGPGADYDAFRECSKCDTIWHRCHDGYGKYHKEPDYIIGWYEIKEEHKQEHK